MADEWDDEIEVGRSFDVKKNYGDDDEWETNNNVDDDKDDIPSSTYTSRSTRGFHRGGGGGDRNRYKSRNDNNRNYNNNHESDGDNDDGFGENNDGEHKYRGDRDGRGRGRGRGRGNGRGGRGGRGMGDDGGGDQDDRRERNADDTEKKRELYIPPEPTEDEDEMFGQGISTGINFNRYDSIPVKVTGDNPPKAVETFEDANLSNLILTNIKKSGYDKPTPIQKCGIPIVQEKRDLMACAQTGSGKTAAFLLPIINDLLSSKEDVAIGRPHCLIISPTRELTIQIFEEARKFAHGSILKVAIAYGGTGVKHQGDSLARGCHILVATPGRLLDFCKRGFVSFEDCRCVVLDEADRMLDMGFIPHITQVMEDENMRGTGDRQTLMFSATFPEEIQHLAGKFLSNYLFLTIGIVGGACADVEQNFYEVQRFTKRNKLLELLDENENDVKGTMVFVETQRNADFLASLLSETKYPTTSIHGARLQRERELALRDFKNGKMSILIATSVAARGLDIKNVDHVINYDLPKSIDDYVHRIGRTGRVGNKGKATSFFEPDKDAALAADLIKILKQADQEIPGFLMAAGGNISSSYKSDNFGGKDVRMYNRKTHELPKEQEPEEEW